MALKGKHEGSQTFRVVNLHRPFVKISNIFQLSECSAKTGEPCLRQFNSLEPTHINTDKDLERRNLRSGPPVHSEAPWTCRLPRHRISMKTNKWTTPSRYFSMSYFSNFTVQTVSSHKPPAYQLPHTCQRICRGHIFVQVFGWSWQTGNVSISLKRNGKRTETKKRCTARLRSGRKSQNARWVLR